MVNEVESKLLDLFKDYKDDRRHPIVAESNDWKRLTPTLVEWGMTVRTLANMGRLDVDMVFPQLRVLMETAYVMGYERGRTERPMPTFMVAETD